MLPEPDLARRYEFASTLIEDAGRLALDYFRRVGSLTIHSKGLQDMASEADLAVEAMIRDRLRDRFGEDSFLGEESGLDRAAGSAGIWVVDPIDGTQPFVCGLPNWCVSIAYVHGDELSFGLVNNPAAHELFAGALWQAATRNNEEIRPHGGASVADGLTYLGASPRVGPEQVVPVLDRLMRAGGMFVRGGSGALGLCDVACGRLVGYVEPHINSWDCLGAIAVLRSAGCSVNDYLTGDALLKGNRIVAGPPAIFDELDAILG